MLQLVISTMTNWPDIYVANDFLEPDVLYVNNKNGTFTDEILSRFKHISANSMGSDFADINNDLLARSSGSRYDGCR